MTLESVQVYPTYVDCGFPDGLQLMMSHKWLQSQGVSSTDLVVGREIFIKGTYGNETVVLASPGSIEAIRLH